METSPHVTPLTPAEGPPAGDRFPHTLPDGDVVQEGLQEELFDTFLAQLMDIREQVCTLLRDINVAFVPRIMSFKRLADKRGKIMIVWSDEADEPVDVCLQAKEAQS